MTIQFSPARRKKVRLRLALAGPSGSGKTYNALQIAFGLGGRIALIDTERGSGELCSHLGVYDLCNLEAPFTPEKYIEAIRAAEDAGYGTIIIDSLSHAWAGPGGVLDIHGYAADRGGNSWAAWRQVTPRHNDLVNAMLGSGCHIIATMRSKTDHVQTTENNRPVVKKVGLGPIQRDGLEYEFDVLFDLDQSHLASTAKDRTGLFDGQVFRPSAETGQRLLHWLETGADPAPAQKGLPAAGEALPDGARVNSPGPPGEERAPDRVPASPVAATPAQVRKIHAMAGDIGLTGDELRTICHQETGKLSTRDMTRREASYVIDSLRALLPHSPEQAGD